MSFYRSILRRLLFRLDPETAHGLAIGALKWSVRLPGGAAALSALYTYRNASLETEVAGLRFPNPVGLAAGYDKNCRLGAGLHALGFGFAELGTLTLRPQPGNPRPRAFRFPEAHALINRFGFNNEGVEKAAARLRALRSHSIPLGLNIGLNKETGGDQAAEDYAKSFMKLYPFGDYFTVNVSSPNTQGLRRLQDKLHLERILTRLQGLNGNRKPLFVKLAPDLAPEALKDVVGLLEKMSSGVICTNTTLSRPNLPEKAESVRGGLSGAPLRELSTRMIGEVYRLTGGRLPIIGVGGIFTAEDAYRKIRAGASLVQIYTGLIYQGPGLAGEINRGLARLLREHGLAHVGDAVGRSHPEIARSA